MAAVVGLGEGRLAGELLCGFHELDEAASLHKRELPSSLVARESPTLRQGRHRRRRF